MAKTTKQKILEGITITLAFSMGTTVAANALAPVQVNAQTRDTNIRKEVVNFSDVLSTHWFYESVHWGVSKGLVKGYEDGTYKPSDQITEQEFATVLTRYAFGDTIKQGQGSDWAGNYYATLATYDIPLKGYSNNVARATAMTRGQIARAIAAKNGFNLTERQAVYYMYENDISYGLIEGTLSYDSYGTGDAVKREQIPAFFKRIDEEGHTTFMGKPSPVKDPTSIGGIKDVQPDKTVITDKMFDDLAKDKGLGKRTYAGTLADPVVVAGGEVGHAFRETAMADRSITNKMVGKVNGIITPVSINITRSDPEHGIIIQTKLTDHYGRSGFQDKEMFLKIIKDHWVGDIIDQNQYDHLTKGIDTYFMKSGSTNYGVEGSKHDVSFGFTSAGATITVHEKGTIPEIIEIRK